MRASNIFLNDVLQKLQFHASSWKSISLPKAIWIFRNYPKKKRLKKMGLWGSKSKLPDEEIQAISEDTGCEFIALFRRYYSSNSLQKKL